MAKKGKYGQIVIEGKENLVKEILTMLPYTTVTLLGAAGTGKTTILEDIAKQASYIDELAILRLQGLSSEDFKMPILVERRKKNTETKDVEDRQMNLTFFKPEETEKTVEFTKLGILKEICDNPDKNYLLFFDEILRADASVAPLLFELLERKIDGIFRPNMFVATAANYDENQFIQNFDYKDPALRRRQIFIEYVPTKDDVIQYMMEKNYHPIIRELVELLPYSNIVDDSFVKELEQTTQLGSWALLNNRWNEKGTIKSYKTAQEDLLIYGNYMFNDKTIKESTSKLAMLDQLNTIDIQKEIIEKNGLNTPDYVMYDKKGNQFDYESNRASLLIRTKYFIKSKVLEDIKYAQQYGAQIALVFSGRPELFASLFNDVNSSIVLKCKAECQQITEAERKSEELKSKFAQVMFNALMSQKSNPGIQKILKEFSEALQISHQG